MATSKQKPKSKAKPGPLESKAVVSRGSHTFSRPNKGIVTIIRMDNDRNFFQLDRVAAEFWNLIDGKRTVGQICHLLMKKHAPPQKVLEREVTRLLQDLRKNKLII